MNAMKLRKRFLKKPPHLMYVPFFVFLIIFFSQVSLAGAIKKNDCEVDIKFNLRTEGLSVNFSDRSKGDYHKIIWDFGDGTVKRNRGNTHLSERRRIRVSHHCIHKKRVRKKNGSSCVSF